VCVCNIPLYFFAVHRLLVKIVARYGLFVLHG